jgi:periplasmic protein TonB
MGAMSGVAMATPGVRSPRNVADDLFTGLVVSDPPKAGRSIAWPVSLIGHGVAIAAVILVPLFWPGELPGHPDYVKVLIFNPPPPPPPPLPRGSGIEEKKTAKPVTPEVKPETPKLTVEPEVPKEEEIKPEAREPETLQAGSETGSDLGVPDGMEGGTEGGTVGGVFGGVLGGCVGCTGDGPVMDYDTPPRPVKITRPQYPQEAFVKKIEGTVEVEILIDSTGKVVDARVVKSIPLLDAAARQTVLQWVFTPAVKHGRPVATVAFAPVTFRIF